MHRFDEEGAQASPKPENHMPMIKTSIRATAVAVAGDAGSTALAAFGLRVLTLADAADDAGFRLVPGNAYRVDITCRKAPDAIEAQACLRHGQVDRLAVADGSVEFVGLCMEVEAPGSVDGCPAERFPQVWAGSVFVEGRGNTLDVGQWYQVRITPQPARMSAARAVAKDLRELAKAAAWDEQRIRELASVLSPVVLSELLDGAGLAADAGVAR